jgi:hypothetical protein
VQTSYRGGLKDDERVINQILDLSIYKGLMSITTKGVDDLAKQVNELAKHSGKIEDALEEIAETLEKGIWIRTPDFIVTLRDTSDRSAVYLATAKLREFQLLWEVSLRDDDNEVIPFAQGLQAQAVIISQQLLVLLANHPQDMAGEMVETASQIAMKLLRLGTMKFYIDGGRSINTFNQLGNSIVDDIKVLTTNAETGQSLERDDNTGAIAAPEVDADNK